VITRNDRAVTQIFRNWSPSHYGDRKTLEVLTSP